jgi:hypothetical protein
MSETRNQRIIKKTREAVNEQHQEGSSGPSKEREGWERGIIELSTKISFPPPHFKMPLLRRFRSKRSEASIGIPDRSSSRNTNRNLTPLAIRKLFESFKTAVTNLNLRVLQLKICQLEQFLYSQTVSFMSVLLKLKAGFLPATL